MRLQLRSAFFLLETCCVLVWAATLPSEQHQQQEEDLPLIQGAPIISAQARSARIAEFVTSHKIPNDAHRKDARLLERDDEDEEEGQAHVDLENFGSTGLLYDDEVFNMRSSGQHVRQNGKQDQDETLAGVRVSSENPTTMLPILTTQRDSRPFDFVPVNIIREDAKGSPFVAFDNKNFEDLGDVSLVPAGSNTRIQVKKGPNGKDYEYEYVYYYYDEEDDGKAGGATASNSQEVPTRTSAPASSSRRGSNRNKYNSVDRTTASRTTTTTMTVEPVINEVIPNGNGNRARQLENGHEEVAEERLPTNTRFPPRSRGNHAVETTERTSRVWGNRQRSALDAVDSSNFRGHHEGPEFPQNLPNGPVRFLGVTPNEGNDEAKTSSRARGRPQSSQEPAPVQENYDEPTFVRKRPTAGQIDNVEQHERGQSHSRQQPHLSREEEFGTHASSVNSSPRIASEERDSYTDVATDVIDSPTTQVPHAMNKVALDLYAFLQQGRNNLVDFVKETDEVNEGTDSTGDSLTTELPSEGTTLSGTEADEDAATTGAPTTTPSPITTIPTTTTTTTTTAAPPTTSEEPSTAAPAFGRGKFKRPGLGGPAISRNRFKSYGSPSSTEAALAETSPTQLSRGRFGAAANGGGFKRARPAVQKHQNQAAEEPVQKESAEKVSVEKVSAESKPVVGRGRYRGTSARSGPQVRTTPVPWGGEKMATSSPETASSPAAGASPAVHRPGGFNKLPGINRRRGSRPGTSPAVAAPAGEEGGAAGEHTAFSPSPAQEGSSSEQQRPVTKLPSAAARPKPLAKPIIKPGAGRLNLRPRPGQQTTTTTTEAATADAAPVAEGTVDEPASEGTEEETREALAESSPPARVTTVNPLNKLRNRNKIQVQPKSTTARKPLPPAARRSHLLPRRKTTEAPAPSTAAEAESADVQADGAVSDEAAPTEAQSAATETSTVASTKHDESRGLSSLLAPRRRIAPRRSGQLIAPAAK